MVKVGVGKNTTQSSCQGREMSTGSLWDRQSSCTVQKNALACSVVERELTLMGMLVGSSIELLHYQVYVECNQ